MAESKGAEIARAYVLVIPSLQGAQKTLTEELVPATEKSSKEAGEKGGLQLSSALKSAAKVAAAGIAAAVAGSVALIKQSLDAYAETEQLAGGIKKLFGSASTSVFDNAAKAYRTAGMSANDYMTSVTGIAAALLKSGISAEEAARVADSAMRDMADNANTFGTKTTDELGQVYSALARQSWAVLDQLNLGYAGTKTGMQQLIADANRWAKENGKAADLSIDSFADVVTAIGYIQESIGIAETTVKEAEGTIQGSLNMLSAAWDNLLAGFGDPAADVDKLVDEVMSSMQSVINNILPTVQRITDGLIRALPKMVSQICAFVPELFPAILEAAIGIVDTLAKEIPNMVGIIVDSLTADDTLEKLIGAAISIALALVEATGRIMEALAPAIPRIVSAIVTELTDPDNIISFIEAFTEIVLGVVDSVDVIIKSLIDEIPKVVDKMKQQFESEESKAKFEEAGKTLMARMAKSFLENDFIRFLYNLSGQGATYTILMRQLSSSDSYSGSSSGTSTVAQNVGGAAERAGAQTFIENVNISADSSTTMDEMAARVTFAKAMARARE